MVRWSHSSSHFDYTGHLEGKNNPKRGSFNSLSKVIWGCFGLALLRLVIGPENSCYSLNQSDAKRKPIMTWLPAFSRAQGSLVVFALNSHWLLTIISFLLIGCCHYFGLSFTTLNWKALYGVKTALTLVYRCVMVLYVRAIETIVIGAVD